MEGPAIALYVQKDVLPFIQTDGLSDFNINELSNWISASISATKMTYNRRSHHMIQNLKFNAIVYIMPERSDESTIENDWIAEMMVEVSAEVRN